MYQSLRSTFDALTTYCVSVGSLPPSDAKMPTKTGTRNINRPTRTRVAKIRTIVGYIIAPLTRRLICVSFSICKATRSRTWSRIPAASPPRPSRRRAG